MADLVLTESHEVPLSSSEVFGLFGTPTGTSWLFDAHCDSLESGSPITLVLPQGCLGQEPLCVLGRIARVVPGKSIQIVHDQPWKGVLKVLIHPNPAGGCSVRVTANVDERGLAWVMQRRGWPVRPEEGESVHRIGLLTSKTGPAAVYAVASEYMAELAVEEINAEGGLDGKNVELVVADDGTHASQAAVEGRRLLMAGCRAVIAGTTSSSFAAVEGMLTDAGRPVIHAVMNEGGQDSEYVLRWGERPLNQVRAAASAVMRSAGGKRWYMIGNDYQWPHGAHRAGQRALAEVGAQVVGNQFVPIGTNDFTLVLEEIERSGADCVLSTLIGADEVAFERQTWAVGLRSQWETLSLVMEESTRERIGDDAARGIWATSGYFQGLQTAENQALLRRYRDRYGKWAPPLSSLTESVYEALLLYAAAVRCGSSDPSSVCRALREIGGRMPRGHVASLGPNILRQDLYLARAVDGGLEIVNG